MKRIRDVSIGSVVVAIHTTWRINNAPSIEAMNGLPGAFFGMWTSATANFMFVLDVIITSWIEKALMGAITGIVLTMMLFAIYFLVITAKSTPSL